MVYIDLVDITLSLSVVGRILIRLGPLIAFGSWTEAQPTDKG